MSDYAAIYRNIWDDPQFLNLSTHAQLLYLTATSHPTLNYAGVLDWRPGRLAALSPTWTPDAIRTVAQELEAALFLIIDHDTEEAFVRSYHRNDNAMKQRNLGVTISRDITRVASPHIKNCISAELWRLYEDRPELKGFEADQLREFMDRRPAQETPTRPFYPAIQGADDPPNDPRIDPRIDPAIQGAIDPQNPENEGANDPSRGCSNGGSPTPSTYTKHPHQSGYGGRERIRGAAANAGEPPEDDSRDSADASRRPGDPSEARCAAHRDVPVGEVPPCGGCARERRRAEDAVKFASERAVERRRADIAACSSCDDFGWHKTPSGAVSRCDHGASSGGEVIPIREVG